MNTFISTFLGWAFFLGAIFGWTFFLAFGVWRVRIMHKERLAKKSQRKREEERKTWLPEPPVLLTPKERREYMLNHIEDGRFYVISSLRDSDVLIVCAQRYDVEEQRLYCYAYLCISGRGDYNLHIIAPIGKTKFCDFLGKKRLRIDLDLSPRCVVFEEENISPYIDGRDYNVFAQSLQAAGYGWKIEKGEDNGLGSYKYLLKETRTK
nr:MAG TPA: Lipopolysaccharide assembly protein A domain [Bacteriophage sp.]